MMLRRIILTAFLCLLGFDARSDTSLWLKLNKPDHFAIMRHANAPGTGDPADFRIGDCSTQRNLDQTGRNEAIAIGNKARDAGIRSAKVYSSQWCRCMDTASELNLGPVQELPALNSFYQRSKDREGNMRSLRAFIKQNTKVPGPKILVTHQVTISALTGQFTRQGETLIFRHTGQGDVEVIGSIPPG